MDWSTRFRRWLEVIADEEPARSDLYVATRVGLDRSTVNKLRNKRIEGDFRVSTLIEMAEQMGLELPQLLWSIWRSQAPPPRVTQP